MSLKSMLRRAVKDAVQGAVGEVIKEVLDGNDNKQTASNSVNRQSVGTTQSVQTTQTEVETIYFQSISEPNSYSSESNFWESDDNGTEYEYKQRVSVLNDFAQFDSGAGEIWASYIYAPQGAVAGYADDLNKPILYLSMEDRSTEAVEAYKRSGTVRNGYEIAKVENSIAEYKTISRASGKIYIRYHYCGKYNKSTYQGVVLEMPERLYGTPFGNEAEKGLELMVSTLEFVE